MKNLESEFGSQAQRRQAVILYVLLIVLVIIFGTVGYMLIEGWNPFDAFYMTTITLATIGYGETQKTIKS